LIIYVNKKRMRGSRERGGVLTSLGYTQESGGRKRKEVEYTYIGAEREREREGKGRGPVPDDSLGTAAPVDRRHRPSAPPSPAFI
jgi:hypothetical protein